MATLNPRTTRTHRRVPATVFAVLLFVVTLAYFGIGTYAAYSLTEPRRSVSNVTPADFGVPFEEVTLTTIDGVRIEGWFMPQADPSQALLLVHGKDSSRTREFSGNFPAFAARLHQAGYSVMMIDMRGHGASGDARFSFGLNEQRDIRAAVDYLGTQAFPQVGLLGVSMGAASSLLATAGDARIAALVVDSPYAEIYPIIRQEWRGASGLPELFLPGVRLMHRLLFGYDIAASRPVAVMAEIMPRPVLILHGTGDRLVPVENAYALESAAPAAELLILPDVTHADLYIADPDAYTARVLEFFRLNLP